MAWYDFLRRRPSPEKEESRIPLPISFLIDVRNKIVRKESFTLVHILVREGDPKYMQRLVGGKLTGSGIGLVVPQQEEGSVYDKLDDLADAPFPSSIRYGHAHHSGEQDDITAGRLFVKAQNSYKSRMYEGRRVVKPKPEIPPASPAYSH